MDVDEFLAHHGVKGMKWGVRKDRGHEGEKAKTKKIAKLDKQYERKTFTPHTWANLHNRAADLSNKHDIDRINNKPQYKNANFSKDSPLRRKYYNEHQQAYLKRVRQAASEYGTNASGTRKIEIDTLMGGDWGFRIVDVKHDALDDLDGKTVKIAYDATGHIVKIGDPVDTTASHGEDPVADFLAHYGVLGMKWGQHLKANGGKGLVNQTKAAVKKDIKERTSTETTARAKPGQLVRVVGGHGRTAHEDAIKARTAEQIAKKNTLDALSNQDLQHLVNRMNLESQYRNLASSETRISAGEKFATDLLSKHDAKVNAALAVGLGPAAPVGKAVINGALKKATVNKAMLGGTVKKKKDK